MLYFKSTENGKTFTDREGAMRTCMVLVAGEASLPEQIRAREFVNGLTFDYVFFAKTPAALAIALLAGVSENFQTQGVEALGHETLGPLLVQERIADNESIAKYLNNPAILVAMEDYSAQALAALQELLPPPGDNDDMILVVVPSVPLAGALAHAWAKGSEKFDVILSVPQMRFQPGKGFVAMFFDDGSLLTLDTPE